MLLNNSGQILSVGFDNIAVKLVRNRFCIHCEGGGGGGLVTKLCPTLATPWTVAHQDLLPRDSPGKNTGVGCHFLLQEIMGGV